MVTFSSILPTLDTCSKLGGLLDNTILYFGTGNDVEMYFDATTFKINAPTLSLNTGYLIMPGLTGSGSQRFLMRSATDGTTGFEFGENTSTTLFFRAKHNENEVCVAMSSAVGRCFIVTDYNSSAQNHDHGIQTNPTFYVHSGITPNVDNTQWGSIAHDQTNLQIQTGKGNIQLGNTTHIPLMPTLTTAQRNALTGVNGMIIYNSDTTQMEAYFNGSWGAI